MKFFYYTCSWNDHLELFAPDMQICKDLMASSPEEASENFSKVMCYFTDNEFNNIIQKYPIKKYRSITLALVNCYTIVTIKSIEERKYHDEALFTDKFKIWTVIDSSSEDNLFQSEEEKRKILRF